MKEPFENDVIRCLEVLKAGGVILYPTDTVWGLGCDATNEAAVKKIYDIKQRDDSKSMIVLAAEEKDLLAHVAALNLTVFDFLEQQERPTTIIYDGAIGLADNLIAADRSIAIRVTTDPFCRHLVKRFQKPIVSTSANISGQPTPRFFHEISSAIKDAVDYVVQWKQNDHTPSQPSQIIKWNNDGSHTIIRK